MGGALLLPKSMSQMSTSASPVMGSFFTLIITFPSLRSRCENSFATPACSSAAILRAAIVHSTFSGSISAASSGRGFFL